MLAALVSLGYQLTVPGSYVKFDASRNATIGIRVNDKTITYITIDTTFITENMVDQLEMFVNHLQEFITEDTELKLCDNDTQYKKKKQRYVQRLLSIILSTNISTVDVLDMVKRTIQDILLSKPYWKKVIISDSMLEQFDFNWMSMRIDTLSVYVREESILSIFYIQPQMSCDNIRHFQSKRSLLGVSLQRSWCTFVPTYSRNDWNQEYNARICTLLEATIQKEKTPTRKFLFSDGDHHVMAKTLQFLLEPWVVY